jgi:hypothetical protein
MAANKLVEMTNLLLANTRAGTVKWEKTSTTGQFQAAFATYAIAIRGPSDAPSLYFFNEEGEMVEDFTSVAAVLTGIVDQLKLLYQLARRQALGADKALDDILNILRTPPRERK